MLKKYGQLFISSLILSDSIVILFSWLAAYYIRFNLEIVPVTQGVPPLKQYLFVLIPVWLIFLINLKVCGLFTTLGKRSQWSEYFSIIKATSLSILMLGALSFFYREESYSRIMVILFWGLCTLFLMVSHWGVRKARITMLGKGISLQKVLIVGCGDLGQTVAEKIQQHPEIGLSVEGYLTQHNENIGKNFKNHKVLGLINDISQIIHDHKIDQLFVALPLGEHDRLEQVLSNLGEEVVDIKVVPDLLRFMNIHSGVDDFDGLPVVNLTETPLYGWNSVIKRIADILISFLAIALTLPLMGVIAILIKLESRGKVIYSQERVGLDGKKFMMYKFRSMYDQAEKSTGPVWAAENDDRRTRFGAFLRRSSLDELPQLFNVLKGNMSIVGPRPERPVFVQDFKKTIPQYMLRLKMKAGLTGWAQVNGWRGNTSLEKRIEYDLYYIKNWSLLFDLKIIFMTIWKGLLNRHAY